MISPSTGPKTDLTFYLIERKGYIAQTNKPSDLQMFRYSSTLLYNQILQSDDIIAQTLQRVMLSMLMMNNQVPDQDMRYTREAPNIEWY